MSKYPRPLFRHTPAPLLMLCGLLAWGPVGRAQPPAASAPQVDVEFRCLGWRLSPPNPFEFFSEGEWVVIDDLNTFLRSREPYHYVGENPLVLYMRNKKGEPEPVCKVDFSRTYQEPLVLFTRVEGQDGLPYRGILFEDHDSEFPPGSFRFVNLTRLPLVGKIGETRLRVDPGRQLNVTPDIEAGRRAVFLLLTTPEEDGRPRVLKSTYLQYDADTKHLTFVLPHPNGRGNVQTFTITEDRRPTPQPAASDDDTRDSDSE